MIIEELNGLVSYVAQKTHLKCSLGNKDLGTDDYPHVQFIPVGSIGIGTNQPTKNRFILSLTVKIIASKGNERDVMTAFERVTETINMFHEYKGHFLSTDGGEAEYTDNTYSITVQYTLKFISK